MQVTELEAKGLTKQFKIVVGSDAIAAKTESELKELGKTAKIAGFRAGHIPMKVLQQRYGKAVQSDVIKHSVDDAIEGLVKENKFRLAVTPKVEITDYREGGDLTFNATLELFPELPELNFEGITLERKVFEVSESDIDETAEKIASRVPQFVALPEKTKAENGHIVKIDFAGKIDGVAFDGGTAEDFDLELGSKQFIDGFEDQLIGLKAGDEKTVKVTFPAKYPAPSLAGKEAEFEVKIKAVQESKTPEVNEEFATSRGFADLAAFREAIRNNIVKEHDAIVRNHLKKQLFDILENKYDFELPESMVEMEFKTIWERVQESKAEGDESLAKKSDEELTEEYKKVARRRVTLGILLAEIGSRNKIQITREEISRAVWQQASSYPGQERQIFEFYQKNPKYLENLRGPILEEKAVDNILNQVKFDDKKVELKDLLDVGEEEVAEEGKAEKKPAKTTKAKKKAAE